MNITFKFRKLVSSGTSKHTIENDVQKKGEKSESHTHATMAYTQKAMTMTMYLFKLTG